MKKILALLFLIFGLVQMCMAQDVCFMYEGKTLENGSWVEIGAQPDSFFPEEKNCMTNNPSDLSNGMFLVAPSKSSASATLEVLSNTLNPAMLQWCMGGLCQVVTDDKTVEKSFTIGDDGCIAVEFDANGVGDEGYMEAKITVTIDQQSVSVNIRFVGSSATRMERVVGGKTVDVNSYDLLGRLSLSGHRGVTIQNGKKYIKR